MNGLGGDSIALWYDSKKKKITVINGSGKSPLKASKKYFNLKGLKKRKFDNLEVVDKVIELDLSRKKLQQNLEEILFESNTISKEIAESLGLPDEKGAFISNINPDGPSKTAGLQEGDVILKFNNNEIYKKCN